jgi:hypothetical protein
MRQDVRLDLRVDVSLGLTSASVNTYFIPTEGVRLPAVFKVKTGTRWRHVEVKWRSERRLGIKFAEVEATHGSSRA